MGLVSPSLSLEISLLDSEVFSQASLGVACWRPHIILSWPFALFQRPFAATTVPRLTLLQSQQRSKKLAPLGFLPLQHLPAPGVHLTRVCLALFVALSGFDYPLSGLLLHGPGDPFFRSQRSWGFPLQSLVPAY